MNIRANNPEKFYATGLGDFIPGLTHIGYGLISKAMPPLKAHTHQNALEIVYLLRGQTHYAVNGRNWPVNGGDVFLSFPHEIHGTGTYPEERVELCWIGVDIGSESNRFLGCSGKEDLALRTALKSIRTRQFQGPEVIAHHIRDIIDNLARSNLPYRTIAARSSLILLLTTLIKAEKTSRKPQFSPPILQAMNLIETQVEEPITLQDLADQVNLSVSHLKKKFRNETGMPPYEYVLRRKMEKAKILLLQADLSVTDIAFQLGFPSSQHFATIFKKMTATTPSSFRKQYTPHSAKP